MLSIKDLKLVLSKKLVKAKKVIIIPHINLDFDAIGSAIGLTIIADKFKKESFILVNDPVYRINPSVKAIIDESEAKGIKYIDKNTYLEIKKDKDLIILADVNKTNLMCLDEQEINSKNVVTIDHHNIDEYTVNTKNKYIDEKVSSASEVVSKLLHLMKIKYDKDIATYLLAGISLDTSRITKNFSSDTIEIFKRLINKGADMNRINELFAGDFESDKKINRLLEKAIVLSYSYATVTGDDSEEYAKEELAKAADRLLSYKTTAASFAIGRTNKNVVSISARSKGELNVGEIMGELGGGGNVQLAATSLENTTPKEAHKQLQKVLLSFCEQTTK